MLLYLALLTALCFAVPFHIHAREPYHATVVVNNDSATVSAPNLVDLKRELSSASIQELIPSYTPVSQAGIGINLRGIDAITFFPAGSTTLFVTIPQANITQSFTGATRDDSITLFKDFVRDAGSKKRLLRAYARYSPIDPIAGNPNSLMAQMGQADYLLGTLSPFSGCCCCWNAQPILHQFQVGLNTERYFCEGFDGTSLTLPLSYSYSPDRSWAFILDAPFTYNRNRGASSAFGSLGVGLRCPVTETWSLTPVLRLGAGGTLDLCTSGAFFSAGVTSAYAVKISNYVFTLIDYVGYIASTNLWLTGVNFNYRLQNYTVKYGFTLTSCEGWCCCGIPLNFSLSLIDTYFTRRHLFMNQYEEIGLSLIGSHLNPYLEWDCLIGGFAFRFGDQGYHAYAFNLAYQF
jgi:hypothetical protein